MKRQQTLKSASRLMDKKRSTKVESRNEPFVERTVTKIWQEVPSSENPYIEETNRCHGYELAELIKHRSYTDVIYLLFRGELPTVEASQLLEQLMVGLINPGPRHPATRAAMNAGVGKTDPLHILPISLMVCSGTQGGAGLVEGAMRFLRKNHKSPAAECAQRLMNENTFSEEGDIQPAPGFGSYYGGINISAAKLAAQLGTLPACGATLRWGAEFSKALEEHDIGWYHTGVAAAVFADLGFQPRMGGGLFQMFAAPGLFAHGIEMANKPRTAMPYVKDENYVIQE